MTLPQQTQCACSECISMCEQYPCAGTPAEIQRLIDLGHGKNLMLGIRETDRTNWDTGVSKVYTKHFVFPAIEGHQGKHVYWEHGKCVFHNSVGFCSIHEIKPMEGRLAYHTNTREQRNALKDAWFKTWFTPEGRALVEWFCQQFNYPDLDDYQGTWLDWRNL